MKLHLSTVAEFSLTLLHMQALQQRYVQLVSLARDPVELIPPRPFRHSCSYV